MLISVPWGKTIDEKNSKQKILWHCPFKWGSHLTIETVYKSWQFRILTVYRLKVDVHDNYWQTHAVCRSVHEYYLPAHTVCRSTVHEYNWQTHAFCRWQHEYYWQAHAVCRWQFMNIIDKHMQSEVGSPWILLTSPCSLYLTLYEYYWLAHTVCSWHFMNIIGKRMQSVSRFKNIIDKRMQSVGDSSWILLISTCSLHVVGDSSWLLLTSICSSKVVVHE